MADNPNINALDEFVRRLVAPEDEAGGTPTVGQKMMRAGMPPIVDMTTQARGPSLIRPTIRRPDDSSSADPTDRQALDTVKRAVDTYNDRFYGGKGVALGDAPNVNAAPQPSPVTSAAFRSVAQGPNMQMPQAPPTDSRVPSLIDQRTRLAQPLNKLDPKYHMGLGQRLLGVLANFSSGVSGHGPVKYIGPGATNRQYDIDEEAREKRLAATDTEIKQRENLAEENRKQYQTNVQAQERSAVAESREAQAEKFRNAIDPQSIHKTEGGRWLGKTYGGEEREVEEPKWHAQEARKTTEDENEIASGARPEYDRASKSFTITTKGGKKVSWQPKSVEEGVSAEIAAGIKNGPYQQRRDRELNLQHPERGGSRSSTSAYDGLSMNERRLVEANAPGMYDRVKDMERQRSEWVSIQGEDSPEVKNIDKSLEGARKVLSDAVQKVLDARAPRKTKQPPAPGSSAANQQGGPKTITKAQIQDLANKNGLSYDAAEKQFTDKGYQVK